MRSISLSGSRFNRPTVHRIIATNDCLLYNVLYVFFEARIALPRVNLYRGNLCLELNFTSHSVYDREMSHIKFIEELVLTGAPVSFILVTRLWRTT